MLDNDSVHTTSLTSLDTSNPAINCNAKLRELRRFDAKAQLLLANNAAAKKRKVFMNCMIFVLCFLCFENYVHAYRKSGYRNDRWSVGHLSFPFFVRFVGFCTLADDCTRPSSYYTMSGKLFTPQSSNQYCKVFTWPIKITTFLYVETWKKIQCL